MSVEPIRLKSQSILGSQSGPHLLVTGGIHGDEFEPMAALRRLAIAPELANLRGKLTLVPVVNEAAFARASRVADDGLDLARTCPGRPDGSITEQTAHALSELIRSADYYIDLHTGGTILSVWPLTGYMLHPRPEVLEKQRTMARAFNLPVIWGTDPSLNGRSLSIARDANIPAVYAEYLGGGRASEGGIDAYIRGCLNVMNSLGMLDLPQSTSNVQIVVEDPRPNSGHMQSNYPSPAAGYFEPAVELGQPISIGQPLGWIIDALGHTRHEILAAQTGRILVLRTFPAVQTNDPLAVILEL
jgi:predicted deacylase